MANRYVSSVAYTAVAQWAASTAFSVGDYRRQLAAPAVGSERVFRCTTAGTSGGTEPAWNLTNNATTNDGTAVWTQITGQEAHQSAGDWTAPYARFNTAATVPAWVAGDVIFVSSDHAETQAAALTAGITSAETLLYAISVSRVGASLPPASADILPGASISTTGANTITIGAGYFEGITFSAGSAALNASITLAPASNGLAQLANCALILNTTNTSARIQSGGTFKCGIAWKNTTVTFGAIQQQIIINSAQFEWNDTASAVLGTAPTNLFVGGSGNASIAIGTVRGVDLSGATGALFSNTLFGVFDFIDCKIGAATTFVPSVFGRLSYARFHNCDNATDGRNYRFYEQRDIGNIVPNIVVVRTGGASDGDTAVAHEMINNTGVAGSYAWPLVGPWINKRINSVGSAKTLTIELISWRATAPTNQQIWMDMEALETVGVPLAKRRTTRPDLLHAGTTLTASTEAWDSGATARVDSTLYSVGQIVKVASNPGRLFYCSAEGTSAGSEPAGYATAVDGDTITDGAATFRAMWRQKITQSFTPQMKGVVRARLAMVFPAVTPMNAIYYDPKLTIV